MTYEKKECFWAATPPVERGMKLTAPGEEDLKCPTHKTQGSGTSERATQSCNKEGSQVFC